MQALDITYNGYEKPKQHTYRPSAEQIVPSLPTGKVVPDPPYTDHYNPVSSPPRPGIRRWMTEKDRKTFGSCRHLWMDCRLLEALYTERDEDKN